MKPVVRPGVYSKSRQQAFTTHWQHQLSAWSHAWLQDDCVVATEFNQQLFGSLEPRAQQDSGASWLMANVSVQLTPLQQCLERLAKQVSPGATIASDPDLTRRFALAMVHDLSKRLSINLQDHSQTTVKLTIELKSVRFTLWLSDLQLPELHAPKVQPELAPVDLVRELSDQRVNFSLNIPTIALPMSELSELKPGMVVPLQQSLDSPWLIQISNMQLAGYLVAEQGNKALYLDTTKKVSL